LEFALRGKGEDAHGDLVIIIVYNGYESSILDESGNKRGGESEDPKHIVGFDFSTPCRPFTFEG
jgi:hypothetical protein